jgi:hypothetical protein
MKESVRNETQSKLINYHLPDTVTEIRTYRGINILLL